MLKSIKRIVAREGLVILSVVISYFAVSLLMYTLPYERPEYLYTVSCLGKKYEISSNYMYVFTNNYAILRQILEEHPEDFNETMTFAIKDGGVPKDFGILPPELVYAPGDDIYRIFDIIRLLLIIAFPIYLILRFIIWAIRMLREK